MNRKVKRVKQVKRSNLILWHKDSGQVDFEERNERPVVFLRGHDHDNKTLQIYMLKCVLTVCVHLCKYVSMKRC